MFNRSLVELSSREDVVVDQPWNQRPFVPYGLGGYNHCVSPVDTHCEIETKCDASRGLHRIQGWTPCSDPAGHPLSVERVYSTAQQYMHQTHRTRLRVGAQNARKLSHVAMSPPAFYPLPTSLPHLQALRVGSAAFPKTRSQTRTTPVFVAICIWIYELLYSLTFRIG